MSARIFWYPQGAPLKKLDLDQQLSEITEGEVRDEVSHDTVSGREVTITFSSRPTVRVLSELITDQTDALELDNLCNHLRRGGIIAVAEDGTRTLGAFLRVAPERGATSITWRTNLFANFGGAFTAEADEVLYLRGPSPKALKEYVIANVGASSGTSLSTTPKHDWTREPWVFVHNKRFWPFLKLRKSAVNDQLLRSTRRIYYTLDLPLEEAPWSLFRIAEQADVPLLGETEEHGIEGFADPSKPPRSAPEPSSSGQYRPPGSAWWRP